MTRPLSEAQRSNPGARGMGRPQVPWRVTGREVLTAIEAGSNLAEQGRRAGVSEDTLRRGLRECGYVVTRLPMDREHFPEVRNDRIVHIRTLARIEERLRADNASISLSTVLSLLSIHPSQADALRPWIDDVRAGTPRLFAILPGDPGAEERHDPDRGPTPYRRAPGSFDRATRSRRDGAAPVRRELGISDREIVRLYRRKHLGLRDIATLAGCTPSTIAARLDSYGVKRRRSSQPPPANTPVNLTGPGSTVLDETT